MIFNEYVGKAWLITWNEDTILGGNVFGNEIEDIFRPYTTRVLIKSFNKRFKKLDVKLLDCTTKLMFRDLLLRTENDWQK